ncbi:MAG: DNA translocase FtsK [Synergistaceae bacterium]|nr:DNA translocase FtsK [Synergistaceae bacterium]
MAQQQILQKRKLQQAKQNISFVSKMLSSLNDTFKSAVGLCRLLSQVFCVLSFAFLVFVLFSLFFSDYTGNFGNSLASLLLTMIGGVVIVPVLFFMYFFASFLVKDRLVMPFRSISFTISLSSFLLLFLGIIDVFIGCATNPFFRAGDFGQFLVKQLHNAIGPFGIILILLLSVLGIMASLGITKQFFVSIFSSIITSFVTLRKKFEEKRDERAERKAMYHEEREIDEDLPDTFAVEVPYLEKVHDLSDQKPQKRTNCDVENGNNLVENIKNSVPEGQSRLFDGDIQEVIPTGEEEPYFELEGSRKKYKRGVFPPPLDLFGPAEMRENSEELDFVKPLGEKIIKTLSLFDSPSTLAETLVGPTVIQFRIQPTEGVKVSRIVSLANDVALSMAVTSLRIEAPIPGKPYVGIEIPNPKRRGIPLRTIIEDPVFTESEASLPLPLGVAVNGEPLVVALEEMPHMLVAGTTGSGKSVFVNCCIVGLCSKRTPDELRMILVDPKRVEMAMYDNLPHLLIPPVTDSKKAVAALAYLVREMEERYKIFACARVRNLEGYNAKVLPKDRMPHIVIVVDEFADLMMTAAKEVEDYVCRLAQMARATGIHLILATQRPSVNVITGLIKSNIPSRVAFTLPSVADSRTILDSAGAEKLLGKGDMLCSSTKFRKAVRIQSPWIDEKILLTWLDYIKDCFGEPQFIDIDLQGGNSNNSDDAVYDDELLPQALDIIMATGVASASGLQRRLRVGFSRASRLIDMLSQIGIIGEADGSRPREILVDEETAADMLDRAMG